MKFQIYRTADYNRATIDALLAKYPALTNYRMNQTKDGVVISITSMKMLARLVDELRCEIIIGKSGWDVKDSIEIYDDYRE